VTGADWFDLWVIAVACGAVVTGIVVCGVRAYRFADRYYDWREGRRG
jgi:hypothetical protein